MAGITIPVLTRRRYDFSSGYAMVPVVTEVDVRGWTSGTLLLRLHLSEITGNSTFVLSAYNSAPTREDPSRDFIASAAVAACNLTSSDVAPKLIMSPFLTEFVDYLRFYVEGLPSGGVAKATVSAELVLKADG